MPNIEVKLRRGTDTEHNTFTGAVGEVTVDTTNDTLRVHDNSTAGGIRLAKHSELGGAGGGGTVTEVDSGTGLVTSPVAGITGTGTIGIADGGVDTLQLATGAVEAGKIADLNVTTGKIADLNVTTGKIADDAVTSAKLAHTTVTPGAYTSADITVDQQGRITAAASGSGGGAAGTPNWSTGWVNTDGTTSVANQATLQFTHNLGTTDLTTTIWVADDSSGTNAKEIRSYFHANAAGEYGATITDLTTTTLELQLLDNGWIAMNSSGQGPGLSFGSPESWSGYYVKVVASASATVGAVSSFTSSETSIPAINTTETWTHSLGQAPDLIQLILRCKTAEYGYSVGDEVRFTSAYTYNIGIYTFWADATNIGFRHYTVAGSVFSIIDRSTPSAIRNPTPANWKIVVKGVVL